MDNNLVELNERTLKVDRANFFALTRGMERHNETIKTAIYVTTQMGWPIKNRLHEHPQLVTLSPKIKNNHPLSDIGVKLVEKYKNEDGTPFKYIAVLTTIFHIKNKIEVWNKLCTNEIFDIWNPAAPYNRLNKSDYDIGKSDVDSEEYVSSNEGNKPQILLLKVYEIDKEYSNDEIESNSSFYHDIKEGVNRIVSCKTPLIEQNDFEAIYNTVKKTLNDYDAYLSEENINYRPPNGGPPPSPGGKTDATTEENLVSSIHNHIQNQGFTFDKNTIINYYLSLKTKPFVILSGITGTGKTKLTKLFADAVCQSGENGDNPQYLLVPIGPDWNENRFLLGYYNPLTEKYNRTPFLNLIIKASEDPKNPYFVCLDEMNLARVEYYFSTFLSAMETADRIIQIHEFPDSDTVNRASDEDLMKYADIVGIEKHEDVEALKKEITNVVSKLPPAKIKIPDNLFITGTVNMDETTFQFSPKVLDRANAIEFTEVNLADKPMYDNQGNPINPTEEIIDRFKKCVLDDGARFENNNEYRNWESDNWSKEIDGFLLKINNVLKKSNLHFGYRTRNEILKYLYFSRNLYSDEFNETIAKDNQILQKILPKIKGPEKIRDTLKELANVIDDYDYKRSQQKLNEMIEALENGYTSFHL